ncbi:hypothetical protein AAG906_029479 [Vitis piasezkii]
MTSLLISCFDGNQDFLTTGSNEKVEEKEKKDEKKKKKRRKRILLVQQSHQLLQSLVPCVSIRERNLLADTAKIVEKNKICKRKDDFCRKLVTDGLLALGYDASVCKSRWEKSSSYPAGEYEYIDVIVEGKGDHLDRVGGFEAEPEEERHALSSLEEGREDNSGPDDSMFAESSVEEEDGKHSSGEAMEPTRDQTQEESADRRQYRNCPSATFKVFTEPEKGEQGGFFKQLLVVFLIQQMAAGLFRLIAGVCRTMIIANTGGALTLLLVFLLGGFIVPYGEIPKWWIWGYWSSPLTYGFNALAVNELYAPRWMNKRASDNSTRLGDSVLDAFDVFHDKNWFWIGAAALLGFAILFNVLFTFSLMYLNPFGNRQAIMSEETATEIEAEQEESKKSLDSGETVQKRFHPRSLGNKKHCRLQAKWRFQPQLGLETCRDSNGMCALKLKECLQMEMHRNKSASQSRKYQDTASSANSIDLFAVDLDVSMPHAR